MTKIQPPAPPYLGPAAHTSSGSNQPITRIVIHGTVSPCVDGGARSVAAYFKTQAAGGSAHYVVDPSESVQVVYDNTIAWHAPPNQGSIGVELCDPVSGPATRWQDAPHQEMLKRAAALVAQLALAYNVPLVKLASADLLAGKHGICGHVDVSQAWHQSDHTDPGAGFPWQQFMALVHESANTLTGTKPAPAPAPAPKPTPAPVARPVVNTPDRVTQARDLITQAINLCVASGRPRAKIAASVLRRVLTILPPA